MALIDQINKGPGMAIKFFSDGSITIAPADNNLVVSNSLGLTGFMAFEGITQPRLSNPGEGLFYYDSAANTVQLSVNGGAYATVNTGSGGTGTVTSVSVATANGVSGTVATPTTTPAISISLGAITPTSITTAGAINGLTITNTTWVQNSVLFVNPTGTLAQDVTNLNWNDASTALGVGQSNPGACVDVLSPSQQIGINIAGTAPPNSGSSGLGSSPALQAVGAPGGSCSSAAANRSGGGGSVISLIGGPGGAMIGASSGTAAGGNGGSLTFTGGAGGNATSVTGAVKGGPGGAGSLIGGAGGTSVTSTSGVGGSLTITAGAGGANATNALTSGGGGSVTIDAGAAGAASGGAIAGNNGNVNIGTTNALNITIGNAGSTTTINGTVGSLSITTLTVGTLTLTNPLPPSSGGSAVSSAGADSIILPQGLPLGIFASTAIPGSINLVQVVLVLIPATITVVRAKAVYTTGIALSTGGLGIYSLAGTKLLDASGQSTATLAGGTIDVSGLNTTLSPGWYWLAWTDTATGVLWAGSTIPNSTAGAILVNSRTIAIAANAASAGTLPATLGALSASSVTVVPWLNLLS
jgi:hypothetical protein